MICDNNGCGCGIRTSSLIITGSGAVGDPYVIDAYAFSIVTSATRPASPSIGQSIYETDTKRYLTWDGSFWIIMGGSMPECVLTNLNTNTAITIADATPTDLVLTNEQVDTDGFHAGTTSVFTIPAGLGGEYIISVFYQWTNNITGYRLILVTIGSNATTTTELTIINDELIPSINTANTYQNLAADSVRLEAGATVLIQAYQTSTVSLTIIRARASLRMVKHIPSLT